MNNFNTPTEIAKLNLEGGLVKVKRPVSKMILLGILAGAFVSFGAEASSLAIHNIPDVGLQRTLAGIVFPIGLMMIIIVGGELFTGNCMIGMGVMDQQVKVTQMLKNLFVVFFSNLVGSLLIALLIFYSGQFAYSGGGLGAFTIKIAAAKTAIDPVTGLISGILCNILVCVAILMAASAKDITGKIFAIFFPIFTFVVSGFEHCVANMYYIVAGMLAKTNPEFVSVAQSQYHVTAEQIDGLNLLGFLKNMIPVTLGNMIGGMVLVGSAVYFIYLRNREK